MSLRQRIEQFPAQKTLTFAWLAMVPIAIATRWIYSIAFVSAASIYANAIGHWSAHRAERAEKANRAR